MSNDEDTELRRGQIDLARDAMKVAILINGAAGIAMLTFLGNLERDGVTSDNAYDLACALLVFGLGVLLGTSSIALSYFSQTYFIESENIEKGNKIGNRYRCTAVITTIISLLLFFIGLLLSSLTVADYLSGS